MFANAKSCLLNVLKIIMFANAEIMFAKCADM
jgi:hypothetical protein